MNNETSNIVVIEAIKGAWEKLHPELLGAVLADDIVWYETPFEEPLTGIDAVTKQWKTDLLGQTKVTFRYEILIDEGDKQVINWHCSWVANGVPRELEGVFYLEINDDKKLTLFKQWTVSS